VEYNYQNGYLESSMGCLKLPYQDRQERVAEATLKILGSPKGKRVKPENCYNYYPLGLTFNSYRKQEESPRNRMNTFQDQEYEEGFELGVGMYDFHARMYDATLGRTWQT
jgi:hypothetical protein